MDIHLAAVSRGASREVVCADVGPGEALGTDPVVLTRCGLCGFCLGARAADDPAALRLVGCPGCGTVNQAS